LSAAIQRFLKIAGEGEKKIRARADDQIRRQRKTTEYMKSGSASVHVRAM